MTCSIWGPSGCLGYLETLGWILPDHVTSANITQWSVSEDCTSACVTLKILLRILKCQHEHLHMTEYNRNSSSAVFLSLQRKAISHSATYFDLWIKIWKNLTSGYAYWWLDMEYSREALRVPLEVNRQTSLCGVCKHHFSQVAFAVVVKSLSHVWLFATSWTAACQASLSLTISQSSHKFMSIESVTLANQVS